MTPTITTQITDTRYTFDATGPTVHTDDTHYRVTVVEVKRSAYPPALLDVRVYGQRLRADGEDDPRSSGRSLIPLSIAAESDLAEAIEAATVTT